MPTTSGEAISGKRRVVSLLDRLDTCAVSDAIDKLGLSGGVVAGFVALAAPRRIAGRVVTVELRAGVAPAGGAHLGTAAIEAAQPGDVIVVAHQGRTDCAGWGGNLSRAAARRGVAGVLVDGAARDIDEADAIEFPVYASAATPLTARGRTHEASWNTPVTIGNITVRPGDFVVADRSGVVFVPRTEVDRVLDEAQRIAAREAKMAEEIEAGAPISQVMNAGYESMLH